MTGSENAFRHLLRGQGCAIIQNSAGIHVDDIAGVRIGAAGFHQLRIAARLGIDPLDEAFHRGTRRVVRAIVDQHIELVGLNGGQECAVSRSCYHAVLSAGQGSSDIGSQSAGAAPVHPAVCSQFFHRLGGLLVFDLTIHYS